MSQTFGENMEPGLGTIPAPSDEHDQESGIAQFGQLHPAASKTDALRIKHKSTTDGFNIIDQASDRYAIRAFTIPDLNAHQLLPVDPHRKIARIQANCMVGAQFGVFIGLLENINVVAGQQGAGFNVFPNVWYLPGLNVGNNAFPLPFEFTSKGALYYCAASTADVHQTILQVEVERFNSGTGIGS